MGFAYIDEKGPQETIKPANKFDDNKRINLGDDLMRSYIADVVYIPNNQLELISRRLVNLQEEYLATKKNRTDKELKGAAVLKGNFKYGIASLKRENSFFYSNLFRILLDGEAKNLLFGVNKMSLVIDARLTEWLLKLEEKRLIPSAGLPKYVLTKYLENEASEEVVRAFFDSSITNKKLAYLIISDLNQFIIDHKGIKRMKQQIAVYKELITMLKKNKHLISENISSEVKFDWDKVSFAVDLWVTEKRVSGCWSQEENHLILDEGIPSNPFENIGFDGILENQDSKQHLGLQIADFIVVIAGSLISKLITAQKYDKSQPEKKVWLGDDWFDLEDHQYQLVCLFAEFLFGEGMQYGIVSDTYFDETLMFEMYLKYISSYNTYKEFRKASVKNHPRKLFQKVAEESDKKWSAGVMDEIRNRSIFGSLRIGIIQGAKRKI